MYKKLSLQHNFSNMSVYMVLFVSGLDTSSFFDASDGQIYCKSCYSHKFGHRGRRAKSVGPVETQKIPANAQNNEAACPTCNGRVFEGSIFFFIFKYVYFKIHQFHSITFFSFLQLKESLPNVVGSTNIVSNVLTATSFWMPLTFLMVSKVAFFATLVIDQDSLKLVPKILNMPKPLSILRSSVRIV